MKFLSLRFTKLLWNFNKVAQNDHDSADEGFDLKNFTSANTSVLQRTHPIKSKKLYFLAT